MTQDNSTAQLVERLRGQARTRSDIQRKIAQAKSLRQEDHDPPRDDLYMWSAPEQTIEWQAADLIEALTRPQPPTSSVDAVSRAELLEWASQHSNVTPLDGTDRDSPTFGDLRAALAALPSIYDPILDTIDPAWADAGRETAQND